jgi:hypothetical protein
VTFSTSVRELPSGNYFVAKGTEEGSVDYISADLSETGELLHLQEGMELPDGVVSEGGRILLFGRGRTWRFYDMLTQEAWSLGETCVFDQAGISPGGSWIAALCDPAGTSMSSEPHVVLEILSTRSGTGQQLVIPASPRTNRNEEPHVTWLSDDTLAIERFWIGEELGLCVLPPSQQSLYCPPGLPKDSGIFMHVDPAANSIPSQNQSASKKGWLIRPNALRPVRRAAML